MKMHDKAWIVPDGPRIMIMLSRPALSYYDHYKSYYVIIHQTGNQFILNNNEISKTDFLLNIKRDFSLPIKLVAHDKHHVLNESFWGWYLEQSMFLFERESKENV